LRCRVRFVSRHRSGSSAQADQIIDVEDGRIKLGRGTDNDVFLKDLRVNYRHADIVVRDFDVVIEAVGPSVLSFNGVPGDRGLLTSDSEVEVGPYAVRLVPNQPGADLTLEIELLSPPPAESIDQLVAPGRLGVGGGLGRKRPLSWTLFLLIIAAGLALPILAHRTPERGETTPEQAGFLDRWDQIWISGELSSSHKIFGARCEVCHERAFIPVRSEACAACHADTQHHFEVARFEFAGFDPTACTDCHSEHQGARGVIPARQSLCTDCHRDLSRQARTNLIDASDFGSNHSQLRPSVVTDPQSGRIERVALGAPGFPKESSNLCFPHSIHLAQTCEISGAAPGAEPLEMPREIGQACNVRQSAAPAAGTVPTRRELGQACNVLQMARQRLQKSEGLSCGDCHRPEPGGVNMLPVRMQDHCAECHRLEFAPGRVLPHGRPAEVIAVIDDYYAARAAGARPAAEEPSSVARQRPGGAAAGAAPAAVAPPQDPLAVAQAAAAQRLEDVFGRSLCGVCHEIARPEASASDEWEVRPVKVAALWMPKARFDHAAHSTVPCTDCHKARASTTSAEVLMPAIETCRDCHGGEQASAALPSTCIMCHVYHRDGLPPMLPRSEPSAKLGDDSLLPITVR
jgi:hypothetical protein